MLHSSPAVATSQSYILPSAKCREPDFGTTFFSSAKATAWWDKHWKKRCQSRFKLEIQCETSWNFHPHHCHHAPPREIVGSPLNALTASIANLKWSGQWLSLVLVTFDLEWFGGRACVRWTQNDHCLAWKGPFQTPKHHRTTGFQMVPGIISIKW